MGNEATPIRPHLVDRVGFGRRITLLREGKGWSGRALAGRTGLERERLRRLERGARRPYLDEATRLAAAFEVTLDALVFGTGLNDQKAPDAPAETGRES